MLRNSLLILLALPMTAVAQQPQTDGNHTPARQNLALHRAAWASSTVDYNQTAHLVTDGICDDAAPSMLIVSTPEGRLPRREAQWTIDGNDWSNNVLMGSNVWLRYDWSGQLGISGVRRVKIDGRVAYNEAVATKGYHIVCQVSADGTTWATVGELTGSDLPGRALRYKLHSDPNKQEASELLPARQLEILIPIDLSGKWKEESGKWKEESGKWKEESGKWKVESGKRIDKSQHFRLLLEMEGAAHWDLYQVHFQDEAGNDIDVMASTAFTSMWMSEHAPQEPQWLKVDLGRACHVDSIVPHWYEEPRRWHSSVEDGGRTVRLIMEEPNESGYYALRELEVYGSEKGKVKSEKSAAATPWVLQRASEVHATGEEISSSAFNADGWIPATVPGTVLTSYINIGAVPNPNYADWVDQISESFFRSNFWYRGVIIKGEKIKNEKIKGEKIKNEKIKETTLLCFDGINWKANVFLNGVRLGRIEGAFKRAEFDVTGLLREGENYVAVEIVCNEHFGAVKEKNENTTQFNGGILGADNPTFHATIGWDWITTVRGREAGIWDDVYLKTVPAGVSLSDPYVQTVLRGERKEERGKRKEERGMRKEERGESVCRTTKLVTPSVFVRNHNATAVTGVLKGWIGDVTFERQVTLPAQSEQEFSFTPDDYPQLCSEQFRLWWPNGYGEPYLYDAGFIFDSVECRTENVEFATASPAGEGTAAANSTLNTQHSTLNYRAGLRQMTYEHINDSLLMYINGRRFVPLGGNWGFSEHNLQYTKREYDAAVGYHRDMNCTMIRNWVGQTGDREFYEACDSLGIMVWQDFWLANPADGPDPYDDRMFLDNAEDYVRRIRQHAAIGLYCGRNEGYPPTNIDHKLRQFVATLSPGLGYISSSADDGVTGHGPYCAQPARVYFERQSGKIHTERGMPAVMNLESMQRTFAPDALWPQSVQWGQHDYTLQGAQRALEFNSLVAKAMGQEALPPSSFLLPPSSLLLTPSSPLSHFTRWSQLINYQGYRAMFESGSRTRSGLLIWMSHPCWPTMVWQTYDYYLDPTAAYFGVKKACEPLHIQLNALTDSVEVVNLFAGDRPALTATATLYDVATAKALWTKRSKLSSSDDSTTPVIKVTAPSLASAENSHNNKVYLLRLQLKDKSGLVSQNDYFIGSDEGNYAAIATLPQPTLKQSVRLSDMSVKGNSADNRCSAEVTVSNSGRTLAPFLRLNLKGEDGDQLLPVIYSDNYFSLLPGESRTVTVQWNADDARHQQPVIEVTSLN